MNVSFNGQSESFSAGQVANITYMGGTGGGDTFENDTNLVSLDYGFGAGNNFTGSTSYNFVYFFGAGNTLQRTGWECLRRVRNRRRRHGQQFSCSKCSDIRLLTATRV